MVTPVGFRDEWADRTSGGTCDSEHRSSCKHTFRHNPWKGRILVLLSLDSSVPSSPGRCSALFNSNVRFPPDDTVAFTVPVFPEAMRMLQVFMMAF